MMAIRGTPANILNPMSNNLSRFTSGLILMSNTLFVWDDLTDNPKTAPKKLLTAFKRAGAQIASSWVEGDVKRENSISYRQICLVFSDSQQVTLRVKQTGDVYQVRLNKRAIPLKNQDDIKRAIIEIVKAVNQNATKFQRALQRKKIALPKGMQSTEKRIEIALIEEEEKLDKLIDEARATLATLTMVEAA
jgi:hypothetical protein